MNTSFLSLVDTPDERWVSLSSGLMARRMSHDREPAQRQVIEQSASVDSTIGLGTRVPVARTPLTSALYGRARKVQSLRNSVKLRACK